MICRGIISVAFAVSLAGSGCILKKPETKKRPVLEDEKQSQLPGPGNVSPSPTPKGTGDGQGNKPPTQPSPRITSTNGAPQGGVGGSSGLITASPTPPPTQAPAPTPTPFQGSCTERAIHDCSVVKDTMLEHLYMISYSMPISCTGAKTAVDATVNVFVRADATTWKPASWATITNANHYTDRITVTARYGTGADGSFSDICRNFWNYRGTFITKD